jgi:hypothetical protein
MSRQPTTELDTIGDYRVAIRQTATRQRAADEVMSRQPAAGFDTIGDYRAVIPQTATRQRATDEVMSHQLTTELDTIGDYRAAFRQTATRQRAADKVMSRQPAAEFDTIDDYRAVIPQTATRQQATDRVTSRQPAAGFITMSNEDIYFDEWREDVLPPYPELWLPPTHTRSIIAGSFHKDSVTPKEERAGLDAKHHRREGSFVKMRWETNVHQDVFRFVDRYDKHAKQSDFELMKTRTELEREVLFKAKASIAEAARHYARDLQVYRARRNKRRYRFPTRGTRARSPRTYQLPTGGAHRPDQEGS